jgi:predicted permease
MMPQTLLVTLKIVSMSLVILIGWLCRRRGMISAQTTSALARFTTDITLPTLIFFQMIDTVDLATLRTEWLVPLLGAAVITLGHVVAWACWRVFARREQAPVFILVCGLSNWIYLCLPIADGLYGPDGLKNLFLANAGIQVVFWTLGVAILHGGKLDRSSIRRLAANPGLIATFLGIILALGHHAIAAPLTYASAHQPWSATLTVLSDALRMVGGLTIPLSLVVTGAQIAGAALLQTHQRRCVAGVVLIRLILVPLIVVGAMAFLAAHTTILPVTALMILAVIAMMPVAVSTAVLTDRFGQDTVLAAQSILWTTLLSILTVPALFALARWLIQ